jgi:hypothetical protein
VWAQADNKSKLRNLDDPESEGKIAGFHWIFCTTRTPLKLNPVKEQTIDEIL